MLSEAKMVCPARPRDLRYGLASEIASTRLGYNVSLDHLSHQSHPLVPFEAEAKMQYGQE